jgi:hypothetical protein
MHLCAIHLIVSLLTFGGSLVFFPAGEKPGGVAAVQTTRNPEDKGAQKGSGEQNGERVPVNLHPNHSEILITLKDLAARFGKTKWNTFYVSPVVRKAEGESVYVYWKEDNSIMILDLPLKNAAEQETAFWVYTGKARIDLAKNVAPAEDKIGSSTFLVSKPWADRIIKDCVSNGRKITVPKRAVKRKARTY